MQSCMAASKDMLDRKKIDEVRPKLGLIDFLSRDQERQGYYTEFLLSARLPESISSLFSCCASLFR